MHHQARPLRADLLPLLLLALARMLFHCATNGQYGFHRDELAFLDNARFLAWGYVAYPPLTPFVGRVATELFGLSLVGVRLFAALAMSTAMVLAGLMARELGGGRSAQLLAALATGVAPIGMIQSALFQYVSFDYLWVVLVAFLVLRLLNSGDRRYWLAIGVAIGLGMLTRYTVLFHVVGLVVGVLLTRQRRDLASPWLWGGVGLALLIWLPNLVWLAQHQFITLEFLRAISARDQAAGRSAGYLIEQLIICINPVTVPLWVAGLVAVFLPSMVHPQLPQTASPFSGRTARTAAPDNEAASAFSSPESTRYQLLAWMFLVPFLLFLLLGGRSYYLAPAYPALLALGSVWWERWLGGLAPRVRRAALGVTAGLLGVGALVFGAVMLPLAPVNSPLWQISSGLHNNFAEQIGWDELLAATAAVYNGLPAEERASAGILAGNYGEAGAINLFGAALGLPEALSAVNSGWLRSYPDPPPRTLVVLGWPQAYAERFFARCTVAGRITNRFGVANEESENHPEILVCRELRLPWPEFWLQVQAFG